MLNTVLLETQALAVSVQKILFSFVMILFLPKGPYIKYVGGGARGFLWRP